MQVVVSYLVCRGLAAACSASNETITHLLASCVAPSLEAITAVGLPL